MDDTTSALDVVADGRSKGIVREDLDKASGGSIGEYFRDAILSPHSGIEPTMDDVLGRNDLG